jgi:hypothetical protein
VLRCNDAHDGCTRFTEGKSNNHSNNRIQQQRSFVSLTTPASLHNKNNRITILNKLDAWNGETLPTFHQKPLRPRIHFWLSWSDDLWISQQRTTRLNLTHPTLQIQQFQPAIPPHFMSYLLLSVGLFIVILAFRWSILTVLSVRLFDCLINSWIKSQPCHPTLFNHDRMTFRESRLSVWPLGDARFILSSTNPNITLHENATAFRDILIQAKGPNARKVQATWRYGNNVWQKHGAPSQSHHWFLF